MILLVLPALAAPAEEVVDFDRAVEIALERGVDPEAARLGLDAARADARTRARAWDPSLTAGAGAGASGSWSPGGGIAGGPSVDLSVQSRASLWTGGELRARQDAARAEVTRAEAELDAARQSTVLAVALALLAVEDARSTLGVREAALRAEEAALTRVSAQVDAGARTPADLEQQRAAVAAARAERIAADFALTEATLDAVLLLRLDPARPWVFVAPDSGPAPPPDLDAALATAAARRPELKSRAAEVEAALAARRAAEAGLRPVLEASATVSAPVDLDGPGATAGAGLDLTVPIADRGVTRGSVAGAEAVLAEARLREAAAGEGVRAEVIRAWAARRSAEAALDAAGARRQAAELALRVVEDRYEAGAALLVEVSAARAAAVDAARQEVAARVDRVRADYTLAWATGGLGGAP